MQGFAGLYNHFDMINQELKLFDSKMHEFLESKGVEIQMIALEPIMSLFFNLIPLELTDKHLNAFFEHGWPYLYKLFLQFLMHNKNKIYQCEDQYEILSIFKDYYHSRSQKPKSYSDKLLNLVTLSKLNLGKLELNWKNLIEKACKSMQ